MPPARDTWLAGVALTVACAALGYALQLTNGTLSNQTIGWLTLTVLLVAVALAAPRLSWLEGWGDRLPTILLAAALALQVAIHLTTAPGIYLRVPPQGFIEHHYLIAAAAVLAALGLSREPVLGRVTLPLLLVVHFLLGIWLLKASPSPSIDVFTWHGEAFRALGQGVDPYGITMPNIYGRTDWYAPGLADATHVDVGYPYPPLSLLLAAPGHLLAGDYRYANLAALTLTGGFIGYARPSRFATGLAALFLFTPRQFFVLEQGWTEANVIFVLAGFVFVACRFPRLLPYALGLLIAVKQYCILIAPLTLLLLPRPLDWRATARFAAKAVGVAAVLTVPVFLWNPAAFIRSVVLFQGKQPFRTDSMSYLAWLARDGVPVLPQWFSFLMAIVGVGVALWRAARSPAGFAAGAALVWVLFFAFAKQAFCNYYFLVVGTISVAAAVLTPMARADSSEMGPASKAAASTPMLPS
jgi:hypothetical protein